MFGAVTRQPSLKLTPLSNRILTITGSGSDDYCYIQVGSTKYNSAQTVTIPAGTQITFGVYGYSSTYYGEVKIYNDQKLKVTGRSTETYTWTPDADVNISMSYTSTSTRRNGKINVTQS